MMQLGSFQFGINTAAYQSLKRSTDYSWQSQDRAGQGAALQFTGPGADTITLDGVVYPQYRAGIGQIDRLRALASLGEPQQMVDGRGNLLGEWVIENVSEDQSAFMKGGIPRKQDFGMKLRRYHDADL